MTEWEKYNRLINQYDKAATTQTIQAMIRQKIIKHKIIKMCKKNNWVSPWGTNDDYII